MPEEEIAPGTEMMIYGILPVNDETCLTQIAQTEKLGLPEAVRRAHLNVIANGPSAHGVDLRSLKDHTLALNGSIKLFLDQGLAPDFWAVCDPQEEVASFLPEKPPRNTTYLVASKCHPNVFRKLKDNDVLVWHVADYPAEGRHRISLCSSVTLSATWLMYRMGFTDFEYWGWDGCFMDGRHHASQDNDWSTKPVLYLNFGGKIENGEMIGGRTFATTRTWAAENKGADQFFQLAKYFDIGIKIHGDGMFEYGRKLLMDKAA